MSRRRNMAAAKKKTFEESMTRLEEIVTLLENNDSSLDETVKLFEEGIGLVKTCDDFLKKYEEKVNDIIIRNGGEEA